MKQTKTVYRLKLDDEFLRLADHDDGTQIFRMCHYDDELPTDFESQEAAIGAICERFYFHHGCGYISENASAKERLAKIKIIKTVITEETEVITPDVYVPTNIEIHRWYVDARGDDGLKYYLKSQCSWLTEQEMKLSGRAYYDDDGYDLADADRIKDYNAWVAAGKPKKLTPAERIALVKENKCKKY